MHWGFALQNFPAKSINISHSGLNNFKNIHAIALQEVDASHTGVATFDYLDLENLRSLNIAHTRISDLRALQQSPLQVLDIRHCPIKSLQPLQQMKYLRQLIVSSGQFSESVLKGLPTHISLKVSQ